MSTTAQPTNSITVDSFDLAKAFEAWNNGVRANPQAYRTPEEVAQMGVSQVSAEQADYFFALLTGQHQE